MLEFFRELWTGIDGTPSADECGTIARKVLGNEALWAEDLTLQPGLSDTITEHLRQISTAGMRGAMENLLQQ